jgi:adhesin/invasin
MAVSSELTTPRFLFVADSNNAVHQISFSNGARITANAVSPLGDIVYANPASTAGASSFIVFGNNQSVAVSGTFAPVVIRVLDANGRPVVNAPVTFTSTNPGLTLTNTTTTTNGLGYAFLSAPTPTANGQYPVTVAAGTATTTVTLTTTGGTNPGGGGVADTGLGGLFAVSGNGQVTLESTPLGQPLVVEVRDDAGKPVPNVPIAFALDETNALVGQLRTYFPSGGETGSVTCPTSISCTGVTDANGRATINFSPSVIQSGVTFRQATILVTAGNRSLNLYVTAVKVSNFTNFLDVRILKPADQGQILEVPAGGTLPGAIQAFVQVNASGVATPVANVGMTVSTGIDPTTGPTVTCGTSGTALSDNTGIATCDLVAGPKSSSLAVPLMVDVAGRRFTLTVRVTQATTPSKIQVIQGGDQHALPGQQLPLTLVAQVQDAAGNPLSGVPVTWTPSNINGVTLTNASTQSDTSGRVSAIAKVGTAPGTHIITLKAGDATATFTVRSDAALGSLVAANTPQTAEVGKTFAQPLVVTLRDTNGTPVANTTVNFAVTSGNATLSASTATTNAQGQASVTATAGATAGQSTITAIVGTLSATFTLTARLPGPSFDLNGLLNGANYQTQRGFGPNNTVAIAPGQILTITGTGIATGVQGIMIPRSLIGPLPTSLGGVQVTIGGTAAPIYNVGTVNGREQVTVQVPWELVAGTNTDIVVNVQGGSTTLSNVPVAEVAPGIFENQVGGQSVPLLVDTTDGRFVGTIARGRTYKAYLVGLGPVTPNTGTNRAGLRDQLVRDTIIVGLNNQGVRVIRAEAVEGVVGVYAVTFEVPNDTNIAPSGQTIGFAVGVIPAGSSGAVIAYAPGVLVE